MRILRSTGFTALAAILGATVFATASLARDATESRDVDEFSRIVIEGAMDLVIEVGGSQSVEVTTDSDYMSRVETRVKGDALYITQEGGRWYSKDIDIEITVRSLDGIYLEGAADIDATGIDSDRFELNINGAGDITLEGTCGTVVIEINGAGDVDAEDLKCKSVDVTINGAGDVDASASESVKAELNGVGDITIHGDPSHVRPRIHGLGSFEVIDD